MNWWDAPEYGRAEPMRFPDNRGSRSVPATLKTEATIQEDHRGRPRLVVKPLKQPERLRIYVGPSHF